MKKTMIAVALCSLFIIMGIASAAPQVSQVKRQMINDRTMVSPQEIDWTGEFSGQYGVGRGDNHTVLGTLEGYYKSRGNYRLRGFLLGNWTSNDGNRSGTIRAIFTQHAMFGKISGDGYNRTARIMGFFRYNETKFIGRVMSWVGPAVYIYGDHWTI